MPTEVDNFSRVGASEKRGLVGPEALFSLSNETIVTFLTLDTMNPSAVIKLDDLNS